MPKKSVQTPKPKLTPSAQSTLISPILPLQLLGNITPAEFMTKYWQKKPLLIRGAIPDFKPVLSRDELFDLAAQDDVESRLIVENTKPKKPKGHKKAIAAWTMANGPFSEDAAELPSLKKSHWTLLVQGVDLHDSQVQALKNQFRFAPDARLDDVMISFATDGGGVGPHFDSYDVFLLQAEGQRRWRIGKQKDLTLQKDVPLKILANFEPAQEFVLEPGDMLYLPPKYAHEGVAVGECMTYSIGFRAPAELELARELLQRFADNTLEDEEEVYGGVNSYVAGVDVTSAAIKTIAQKVLYKDAGQAAVEAPAQIPVELLSFARQAVEKAMSDPDALARNLGEYLTEPKANVWFDAPEQSTVIHHQNSVELHLRSQMLFDNKHIFLNGECWRAAGADAKLLQKLANQRYLTPNDLMKPTKASQSVMVVLQEWLDEGWLLSK